MTYRRLIVVFAVLSLLGCGSGGSRSGESEPLSAEELFERAGEAYRATPALDVTFTTMVEFPDADPGERVIRYVLGEGNDAEIDIVSLMRIVATRDTVYIERQGLEDRYLATPLEGDLGTTLANMRGRASLAGARESPQGALRAGKPVTDVLEALRYSGHLGELEIVDSRRLPDSRHEVRLEADNGSCTVRFDPESYFIEEVDYVVRPPGSPEGWAMHAIGRYETRPLSAAPASPVFDPGDRTAVRDFQDLATPAPGVSTPPLEVISPQALAASLLDLDALAEAVRDKRVLLVGEDHLYHEPPAYLTALLDRLDDRPISILLELPYDAQPSIDRFIQEGDEQAFDEIFERQVLQVQHILRWARENRDRLTRVEAIDEPLYEIQLRRSYATDTRNPTMAEAIFGTWEDQPDGRVVVYAGQLHVMKSGRYRWNEPSRDPAGSRIFRMGVPRSQVATIMLNGGENFHLHEVWEQPGALPTLGDIARIPVAYFVDYPIFGATTAGEFCDYFVNLGPLTLVEME